MCPEMTELSWVDYLKRRTGKSPDVLTGIGDDCAWVRLGREKFLLKSDLFIEDVHFKLKNTSFEVIGQRAVARVLSDFAACGGWPKFIGISLGLPGHLNKKNLKLILSGVLKLAKQYKFSLVGGDTSKSSRLFLDVWGLGTVDKFIARDKAKTGDYIFVTGQLGNKPFNQPFRPRLEEAKILAKNFKLTSMIDISDGFIIDLCRILALSRKGACVAFADVPVTGGRKDLYRGEDYELIFTVSPSDKKLTFLKKKFYCVGRIMPESFGCKIKKGNKLSKIALKGYQHF